MYQQLQTYNVQQTETISLKLKYKMDFFLPSIVYHLIQQVGKFSNNHNLDLLILRLPRLKTVEFLLSL